MLFCANAGDSRAVLSRGGAAIALSEDHKPNRKDEERRIREAGGEVVEMEGIWRVKGGAPRGGQPSYLSTSRGIGDLWHKVPNKFITAEPDVKEMACDYDDEFICIASDGVFDVLDNQAVIDLIRDQLAQGSDATRAAEALVKASMDKGSEDNLTALVVRFGWAGGGAP